MGRPMGRAMGRPRAGPAHRVVKSTIEAADRELSRAQCVELGSALLAGTRVKSRTPPPPAPNDDSAPAAAPLPDGRTFPNKRIGGDFSICH